MLQLLPKFLAIANAYSAFSISYPIYTSFNDRLNQSISNFESYGSADFKFDSPIVFNNISFSHHKSSPILQDLSFSIPMNKTICIVGKSGAGKSTVLDLLTGLIIPHSGSISYGSIDNSQVNYSKLRSDIAYVGQETTLFPGTILENLVFRCSHVSYQEVIEVCEMVQISDFVNDLPLGLNTKVGENGISLSGGQRQRLALGRALLSRPKLLLLDEATSALDLTTESIIRQTINNLNGTLTIVIVTHRIESTRDADQVFLLSDCKISPLFIDSTDSLNRSNSSFMDQ